MRLGWAVCAVLAGGRRCWQEKASVGRGRSRSLGLGSRRTRSLWAPAARLSWRTGKLVVALGSGLAVVEAFDYTALDLGAEGSLYRAHHEGIFLTDESVGIARFGGAACAPDAMGVGIGCVRERAHV